MGKRKKRKGEYGATRTWPAKGRRVHVSAAERMEWVRDQWRADPTIAIGVMQGRLAEVFGVTARDAQLAVIRDQVRQEKAAPANGHNWKLPTEADYQAIRKVLAEHGPMTRTDITRHVRGNTARIYEASAQMLGRGDLIELPSRCVGLLEHAATDAPPRPRGDISHAMRARATKAEERKAWCAEYIKAHPHAAKKDVVEACRAHFGVGVSANVLIDLMGRSYHRSRPEDLIRRRHWTREYLRAHPNAMGYEIQEAAKADGWVVVPQDQEIAEERRALGISSTDARANARRRSHREGRGPGKRKAKPTAIAKRTAPAVNAAVRSGNEADTIRAAVAMILDEIPTLHTLTVTVDEHGTPHTRVELREIRKVTIDV